VCRTIAVSGAASRILSAACSPSRRGTCTSRRTRSGARASVSATASTPSTVSPTTRASPPSSKREPPRTSSRRPIGVTYLHHLLHRFDFDKRLTLAAYNQGRLASAGTAFPETRAFVRNVVASSAAWEVGTLARGIGATGARAHGECDMRLRVLVSGLTFFAAAMLAAVAPFVANA
jgi:hypothetical protein